jgi:predicted RNA-binding protein with RPS1 domain
LDDYLNQTLDFKILEFSRGGRQPRVVLSRKVLLEIESRKARRAFWETAEEGQVRRGIVRRLTNFGAFVDVGGCDGLLHVSEMAWGKVGKPSDIMSVDDELDVCLVKLDRAKDKVSLSLRKLLPNPWDTAAEKYRVDEIYTGRVMRNVTFGAFIQLEPGLDGLAHISQLANFRLNKVEDVLLEGMEVQVKVVDIDMVHRRISLSVKDVMDLPLLAREEAPAKETPAKEAPAKNEKADEAAERPRKRRAKARAGAEAGAGAEAEAEAGAEASADAGVEAGAEAEAVTDAGAEAGAGAKASAGASADAGADAGAEAEAATDAGVEAGAGAGADSEAEAEAGGDAGTAANAAEAETEAKA